MLSCSCAGHLQPPQPPLAATGQAQVPWDALEDLVMCAVLRCRCSGAGLHGAAAAACGRSQLPAAKLLHMPTCSSVACLIRVAGNLYDLACPVCPDSSTLWLWQLMGSVYTGRLEDIQGVLGLPWPLPASRHLSQLAPLPGSKVPLRQHIRACLMQRASNYESSFPASVPASTASRQQGRPHACHARAAARG